MRPWSAVSAELRAARRVALTRVVDNGRHSPGTRGAMLWLTEAADPRGTIGGGVMERGLVEDLRRRLVRPEPPLPDLRVLHHRADADGEKSGLVCAGWQANLTIVLDPGRDGAAIERLAAGETEDRPVVLRVDRHGFDTTIGEVSDVGPPVVRPESDDWSVREVVFDRRRVAIAGAGHCGEALARTMVGLGWRVDVWDTRAEIVEAAAARVSGATFHPVADLVEAGAGIRWPEWTSAVVMTTSLVEDVAALRGWVPLRDLPFLGLMGAPAKLEEIRRRLRAGFAESALDRIVAPVGLPIGSDTPPEIAVSVAAQLLAHRAGSEAARRESAHESGP